MARIQWHWTLLVVYRNRDQIWFGGWGSKILRADFRLADFLNQIFLEYWALRGEGWPHSQAVGITGVPIWCVSFALRTFVFQCVCFFLQSNNAWGFTVYFYSSGLILQQKSIADIHHVIKQTFHMSCGLFFLWVTWTYFLLKPSANKISGFNILFFISPPLLKKNSFLCYWIGKSL